MQKNKSYVGLFISYVGLFISYVGLFISYVGVIKSYVGLYKSYVGDKTSYVRDKKSYVGLIFLHICCGPRKLPYKTVCENLPSTYHFRHRHCTTRCLIKPKTVSDTLRFTHALPYIKIYNIYILIFTIFNSKWAKRRVTSRGHRDETSITFLFCFVLFCFQFDVTNIFKIKFALGLYEIMLSYILFQIYFTDKYHVNCSSLSSNTKYIPWHPAWCNISLIPPEIVQSNQQTWDRPTNTVNDIKRKLNQILNQQVTYSRWPLLCAFIIT